MSLTTDSTTLGHEARLLWVNGRPQSVLHPLDRGLAYGDGLFETMRVIGGAIPLLDFHLQRLASGLERLDIHCDPVLVEHEIAQLLATLEASEAQADWVLKLTVTSGVGGRGYLPALDMAPSRILALFPGTSFPAPQADSGVTVRLCRLRLSRQPVLAGIKHLNRLEQVLARSEWRDPQIAEGILRDEAGHLVDGVISNLFAVRNGVLETPDLSHCGVAGVMRRFVIERCIALSIPCRETSLSLDQVLSADEIFMTNSLFGIWPVVRWLDEEGGDLGWAPRQNHLNRRLRNEVNQLFLPTS